MPIVTLVVEPLRIIRANKKRTLLTMTNTHGVAIAHISDKSQVTLVESKWIIYPGETLIFDGQGDKPERAYHGRSDIDVNLNLVVGWQNEEK